MIDPTIASLAAVLDAARAVLVAGRPVVTGDGMYHASPRHLESAIDRLRAAVAAADGVVCSCSESSRGYRIAGGRWVSVGCPEHGL